MIITLSKSDLRWCEEKADKIESLNLRSRKQSERSERETNIEGIRAELAAAKILCLDKTQFDLYKKNSLEKRGSDRGRDLEANLTGLNKPIEIKFTPIKTDRLGFLFLRPPNRCGLAFDRQKHIDDSYFVLIYSQREDLKMFELLGWVDAKTLKREGKYNPIPRKPGQYETFGIHWKKMFPMNQLLDTRSGMST